MDADDLSTRGACAIALVRKPDPHKTQAVPIVLADTSASRRDPNAAVRFNGCCQTPCPFSRKWTYWVQTVKKPVPAREVTRQR